MCNFTCSNQLKKDVLKHRWVTEIYQESGFKQKNKNPNKNQILFNYFIYLSNSIKFSVLFKWTKAVLHLEESQL